MVMSSTAREVATADGPPLGAGVPAAGWRPAGAGDALATLDRLARHCEYECATSSDCLGDECDAWRLENTAASYLAAHWVEGQD